LSNRHRAGLAQRLREIREDLYGEYGSQFLADALEIPLQTWLNYESGVVMPADIVLQLLVTARVNPYWLLTGQGEMYAQRSEDQMQGTSVL
jgi:hypothetical protein